MASDLSKPGKLPVVLAAAAHPDDIEFLFAGTLLALADLGCPVHMWNLCNGHCGSLEHDGKTTVALRREESEASAKLAGATLHPPLFDDLGVYYDLAALARVAAVVRRINPGIILTHSPADYMEDHQNVCRLVTSAAFAKGMPNFSTEPPTPAASGPLALYHAPPHGLRDGLDEPARCSHFVDVAAVLARKRALLACHRSQDQWLNKTQGMSAYIKDMEEMMKLLGTASGCYTYAEGWKRHNPIGFCPRTHDPLTELLQPSGLIFVPETQRCVDGRG